MTFKNAPQNTKSVKATAIGLAQATRVPREPKVWDKTKAPSAADVVEQIDITSIDIGPNDRTSPNDRASIEQLAQSMSIDGQLQPIGVALKIATKEDGDAKTHFLIYGHRRIAAARMMGWTKIIAKIFPAETTLDQIQEIRLVENAQRENLSPVDEALATARLLNFQSVVLDPTAKTKFDNLSAFDKKKAIKHVAEKLGMPVEWVTDRAYLTRLCKQGETALRANLMPLSFAREICKIADPVDQADVVEEVQSEDSFGPTKCTLEELQSIVGRHVFNLAKAPWKLSLPFAGKPACDGCQYNSLDTPDLFGNMESFSDHPRTHDGHRNDRQIPVQGICTNAGCYRTKFIEASKLLSQASAKAVKLIEDEPKTKQDAAVTRIAKELTPPALHTPALADRIRDRRERSKNRPKSNKASASSQPTASQLQKQAENKGQQEWRDACTDACMALEPKIAKALKTRPGLWIIFHLITQTKLYQSTHALNDKTDQVVKSPAMKGMLDRLKNPGWDDVVTLEKECGLNYDLLDTWYDGRSGMAAKFAEALGIEFKQPKIEDFVAKAKKELEKGGKP
jgi:ParB/RepB/Spo0J family partition protein